MWPKATRTTSEVDNCPKDAQGAALNRVGADKPSVGPAVDLRLPCSDPGRTVTTLSESECIAYVLGFIGNSLYEGAIDEELASVLAESLKRHYKLRPRTRFR